MKPIIKVLAFLTLSFVLCCTILVTVILINDFALREYLALKLSDLAKNDLPKVINPQYQFENNLSTIELILDPSSISNLKKQIKKKLSSNDPNDFGKSNWKYVKGVLLNEKKDSCFIDIRIRGDMPSNYNRGLTDATYRLNMTEGKCFEKRKFSLIRPFLENHSFYGYLYYNFIRTKNLFLATEFHFINLTLNGEDVGIYIFQEAFSDDLAIGQHYPSGIIFKFTDDCYDRNGTYNQDSLPQLILYDKKRTFKSSYLSHHYDQAIYLFNLFRHKQIPIDSIFDLEKFAEFAAINEIFAAHHANYCQNIRLFYNSDTEKFEPIAWDPNNFSRYLLSQQTSPLPVTNGFNKFFFEYSKNATKFPIYHLLSQSDTFQLLFSKALSKYLFDNSIIEYLSSQKAFISSLESAIFYQNFQQTFNENLIIERIKFIKSQLSKSNNLQGLVSIHSNICTVSITSNNIFPIQIDKLVMLNTTFNLSNINVNYKERFVKNFVINESERKLERNYYIEYHFLSNRTDTLRYSDFTIFQ